MDTEHPELDISYFGYFPNKGAVVFFAIAFSISAIVHIFQCISYKAWTIMSLYAFSATVFAAGFIVRAAASFHADNLDVVIASICMILMAAPFVELGNYHILARILYYVPYKSPVHPNRVFVIFALLSMVVETLSGNGGNMSVSPDPKSSRAGHIILKVALVLQLFVELTFIALIVTFHWRCHRSGIRSKKLAAPLRTLYLSTALIMVRTLYRTVEYFLIPDDINYYDPDFRFEQFPAIVRYEWYFYVFEATPMFANLCLLNLCHPRRWLPKSNKLYLAKDGKTERTGPGWKDTRVLWRKIVDPMDFGGVCFGRTTNRAFSTFWDDDVATDRSESKRKGSSYVV